MLQSLKPHPPTIDAKWVVHVDGATFRENPSGFGGWGFTVWVDGKLYYAAHGDSLGYKGNVTSAMVELTAAHRALYWCYLRGLQEVALFTDSKFCIDQLTGVSRSISGKLQRLTACIKHTEQFVGVEYSFVPRTDERQRFTDFLSKLGMSGELCYTTLESHNQLIRAFMRWESEGSRLTGSYRDP